MHRLSFAAIPPFLALVLLLMAAPGRCYALEDLEFVTAERAKELGIELRTNAAGPEAVRIELEFAKEGDLKGYVRVALDGHDDGKLLVSCTLREEDAKPGRVLVGFTLDRTKLDRFEVKVVTLSGAQRVGHILRLKEFVDLNKIR